MIVKSYREGESTIQRIDSHQNISIIKIKQLYLGEKNDKSERKNFTFSSQDHCKNKSSEKWSLKINRKVPKTSQLTRHNRSIEYSSEKAASYYSQNHKESPMTSNKKQRISNFQDQTLQNIFESKFYTQRLPLSRQTKFYQMKRQTSKSSNQDNRPIHSRKNKKFKIYRKKYNSAQKQKPGNKFMTVSSQKLQNFNDYSLNFIARIQKQAAKNLIKQKFSIVYDKKNYQKKRDKKQQQPANKTTGMNTIRGLKYAKKIEKIISHEQCRPWSRISENQDENNLQL